MTKLIQISIAEYQFVATTDELRQEMLEMERTFSLRSGIDWQFEYRWMLMTKENYLLAKIKHGQLLSALTTKEVEL